MANESTARTLLIGIATMLLLVVLGAVGGAVLLIGGLTVVGSQLDEEFSKAQVSQAEVELLALDSEIQLHILQNGTPPATLDDLTDPPTTDPWGHPWVWTVDGSRYEVGSLGADGAPGGTGIDADLLRSGP